LLLKCERRKLIKGEYLYRVYNTEKTAFIIISGLFTGVSKDTVGENALFDPYYR